MCDTKLDDIVFKGFCPLPAFLVVVVVVFFLLLLR